MEANQTTLAPRISPIGKTALLCTNIFISIGLFSLGPALPRVQAALHPTALAGQDILLIGTIAGFIFAITSLFIGPLIERAGYRLALFCALLVFAVAGCLGASSTNGLFIIITRGIVGIACAIIMNASLFAVGRVFPEKERPRILGVQGILGALFSIVIFPIAGILGGIDWRLPFLLHFPGLLFAAMILTLPPAPAVIGQQRQTSDRGQRLGANIILSTIIVGVAVFVVSIYGSLYLASFGVKNALLLSSPATLTAIGATIGASLYVVSNKRLGLQGVFVMCLSLITVGLATVGFSLTAVPFLAGVFCTGIGAGMFQPNVNAAAILASPDAPGRPAGIVNGLYYGSLIVFPLVASPLSALLGGTGRVILLFAVVALVSATGFATKWPRRVPLPPFSRHTGHGL